MWPSSDALDLVLYAGSELLVYTPIRSLQMQDSRYATPTLINLQPMQQHIYSICLTRPYEFEPIGPTILLVEEPLPIRKASLDATPALRRVRAVEVGNVLIAYIPEPTQPASVPKEKIPQKLLAEVRGQPYQWILLASSNSPSAMECTGASPHLS